MAEKLLSYDCDWQLSLFLSLDCFLIIIQSISKQNKHSEKDKYQMPSPLLYMEQNKLIKKIVPKAWKHG